MHPFNGFGGGWMMIVWWAVLIVVVAVLVKWIRSEASGTRDSGETALEILRKRYARGEIDREEYEKKKRELTG